MLKTKVQLSLMADPSRKNKEEYNELHIQLTSNIRRINSYVPKKQYGSQNRDFELDQVFVIRS